MRVVFSRIRCRTLVRKLFGESRLRSSFGVVGFALRVNSETSTILASSRSVYLFRVELIIMGVSTKVLLVGNPGYEEISQALGKRFECQVDVCEAHFSDFVWLKFLDPESGELRQMSVFQNTVDGKDVYSGPATLCSLGAFDSSVEIATSLAERFGGYVCASDVLDEWVFVESTSPDADLEELSPEDAFNVSISRVLPVKVALVLRDAIRDPYVREGLIQAIDALREAKEDRAPSVSP
ncbi:hypothetical protein [Roseibium sp. RKSG952]|uniref:hypothetical protein n=1 Tax=Roseibium sp. RKSG952 TaxID=2529384 RepID=UPI0013C85847|nr:hypothetical protein [Roseibium sp. RKSG952]MTH97599.1 hypothetical protein [Roseibium sp. RKSG952]